MPVYFVLRHRACPARGGADMMRPHESETADGTKIAIWRPRGIVAVILRFAVDGEITRFDPSLAPELWLAREKFPQHEDLWDAVRGGWMALVGDPGAALELTAEA